MRYLEESQTDGRHIMARLVRAFAFFDSHAIVDFIFDFLWLRFGTIRPDRSRRVHRNSHSHRPVHHRLRQPVANKIQARLMEMLLRSWTYLGAR